MNFEGLQENGERLTNSERTRMLLDLLKGMQADIKATTKAENMNGNFVDTEGRVKPLSFDKVVARTEIDADLLKAKALKKKWSGAGDKSRQNHYRTKFGLEGELTEEQMIGLWTKERNEDKSGQIEMLMTLLLHANLKDKFIVVRASEYDDFFNGVDNLIIDKDTGEIICAFDEVVESEKSLRPEEKRQKILERAKSGGTRLKYGATFSDGKMHLQQMSDLPLFYLSLKTEEIEDMLHDVESKQSFDTDKYKTLISALMDDILIQRQELLEYLKDDSESKVRVKIEKVERMVSAIKKLVSA